MWIELPTIMKFHLFHSGYNAVILCVKGSSRVMGEIITDIANAIHRVTDGLFAMPHHIEKINLWAGIPEGRADFE